MLEKSPEILIIPIDNRPVCYDLIVDSAKILDGAKVHIPEISLLGDLTKPANIESLFFWLEKNISSQNIDFAILSLDTLVYGGLIPSRRSTESFEKLKAKVDKLVNILKSTNNKIKIYAFSSIMRISNNNCNEEEKSYWANYGKDLFQYSYLSHKLLSYYDVEIEAELISLSRQIPFEVIEDYLDTRKRNYELNSYYIDLAKQGIFDKLVFSQDDCSEFGFNVEEKELLVRQALKEKVSDKVIAKTGADEMPISLLSLAFTDYFKTHPLVETKFFVEDAKNIISRYEDLTIEQAANTAINLCGGIETKENADLQLLINAPNEVQDELCLEIFEDEKSDKQANELIKYAEKNNSKQIIADVKNANGGDNYLVEKLLNTSYQTDKFFGYSAWNTTGNTLGTAIAIGIIKHLALKNNVFNEGAFKTTQMIRLLDDWAYQANVRKILRDKNSTDSVAREMQNYVAKASNFIDYNTSPTYEFPWDRTFEIRIKLY